MNNTLSQDAISAALSGNWEKARAINLNILKNSPSDTDALNRLSRAYAELGRLTKARQTAKKVLRIDPFNTIATKSLDKWRGLKTSDTYKSTPSSAQAFLEEPGKTKIVSLLHLGSTKVLVKLDAGDEVKLSTRAHKISVVTVDKKYIGRVPDDVSARLKKLVKHGNEYAVYIKSNDRSSVKVFIRETKRAKVLRNTPSFSSEKIDYVSFTPPELVHKKTTLETEDEE